MIATLAHLAYVVAVLGLACSPLAFAVRACLQASEDGDQ